MANHCYNYITVGNWNNLEEMENFVDWLGHYQDFNYLSDWVESLLDEEFWIKSDEVGYKYGSRWFDFTVDFFESEVVTVYGDSAWSPLLDLFVQYSLQCPHLIIEYFYEESGNDIGGDVDIQNGQITGFQGSWLANIIKCGELLDRIEIEDFVTYHSLHEIVEAFKEAKEPGAEDYILTQLIDYNKIELEEEVKEYVLEWILKLNKWKFPEDYADQIKNLIISNSYEPAEQLVNSFKIT